MSAISAGIPGTSPHFMILPAASAFHMIASCSVVTHCSGFAVFTTTDSASFATVTKSNSIPFSAQSAASSSLIKREAFEASVSPLQNFSKPPPVPEMLTETRTPGLTSMNNSAATSEAGPTVEEPSITIEPVSSAVVSSVVEPPEVVVVAAGSDSAAQPASTRTDADISAAAASSFFFKICLLLRMDKDGLPASMTTLQHRADSRLFIV